MAEEAHPLSLLSDDAPRRRGKPRAQSALIEGAMQEVMDVARAKDPGESQIGQMTINLQALAKLAAQGEAAANRGGGKGGGPLVTILVAAVVALSASLGVPAVTGGDDAAATATAAVAAKSSTHAAQISAAELRLTALESRAAEDERRARRHLAMTVRWLGDSHMKQCLSMQAIATALEVEIDCTATVRPPELDELVAQLKIAESQP